MQVVFEQMLIAKTNDELRAALLAINPNNKSIGFVPTMGALHSGHIALVAQSIANNFCTIVSVFVNPKQFNNQEDFNKYPQKEQEDADLLAQNGCDILFMPNVDEIYNVDYQNIALNIQDLNSVFEGPNRPGHFDGVVAVVYRLFKLVNPSNAYFGLKDYQQCMVIQKLKDTYFETLNLHFCQTVREPSGLAMSSRNARLSDEGRQRAAHIYKAMEMVANGFNNNLEIDTVLATAKDYLMEMVDGIEYFDVANRLDLQKVSEWQKPGNHVLVTALSIENVRLIDNLIF